MKILIFGGNGMLGHKLLQVLEKEHEVWISVRGSFTDIEGWGIFKRSHTIENVNAADTASFRLAIQTVKPDVVINAIGVIKQLPISNDVITTLTANSIFPHQLAGLSREFGFRLISVSSDCVFDGERGNYNEHDFPNAIDLYSKSKVLGEVLADNCLTLRTAIIGRELGTTNSLVEWFISNRGKTVKGFVNAIYNGFPTVVFANIIGDVINDHPNLAGLYHVSSEPISKFDLLTLIKSEYNLDINIEPFEDFKIDRSLDSTRFREKTGFFPQPCKDMIKTMVDDSTLYDEQAA